MLTNSSPASSASTDTGPYRAPAAPSAGPIRILYVIDTLEVGGAESSLLQMAERLDRERFELTICTLYRGSTLKPAFESLGIRVLEIGLTGKYQFAAAFRALRRVVLDERPTLLHTTLFRADQVGRAVGWWLGCPVISSFVNISYDPARLAENPRINPRKLAWLRRLDAWTARWVTRFHAVSGAVRDSNCRYLGIRPERVEVVHRGRDVGQLGQTYSRNRARAELGLTEGDLLILNVGRLVEQKAQEVLIRAMPEVVREFPSAKLWIAGEGNLRPALTAEIDTLGLNNQVSLLGQRNDIARLLAAADCFAFPSIYEGLPGAVVEAMLAGCPIVASDLPVIQEVIQHEATGLLVSVRSHSALACAICSLLQDRDRARLLGLAAQQSALERFDIRRIVARMEELYGRVAEEHAWHRSPKA